MWRPLSAPFSLKQNSQYYADLHLSWLERQAATPNMIVQKFEDAGFANVAVLGDLSRATGTWGQPDQNDVELPSQVARVCVWQP